MRHDDDQDLIQGYLEGRPDCHRCVDRWIGQVLGSRHLMLGADREDVAQEVRRKLLLAFREGRFQGDATLKTYVWRAAQHAALNQLRGRRRRRTEPLDESLEPAGDEDPARDLAREERRALARRVLQALGEECRSLWALSVLDELPYRVVAERLGLSEGAVKVRALRCRRKAAELYRGLQATGQPRLSLESL